MLKTCKRKALNISRAAGMFAAVADSRWRRQRLLILCYHGIAVHDEHEFNGDLYLEPPHLARRMELLRKHDCTVLGLDEGFRRLREGTLPRRSVAITVDDGGYDCYREAWPVFRRFGYPFTVYLTTFYCGYNRPIFPLICFYLLWKARTRPLDCRGIPGLDDETVSLDTLEAREAVARRLAAFANRQDLSSACKDELARQLSERLGVDYQEIIDRRLFQLMNPGEVREMSAAGVDFQLHTHRHRTPLDRELFVREIVDNRHRIEALTGSRPRHFCYPSGVNCPEFLPWLEAEGVITATTCFPEMASRQSNPLLLPRMVDHGGLSDIEFEAWLTGVAAFLPKVNVRPADAPSAPAPRA